MTRTPLYLLTAIAIGALAVPAFARDATSLIIDQYRAKIAAARAEPGVAENGSAELAKAEAQLPQLAGYARDGKIGTADAITRQVDTLLETARTRAKIASLKTEIIQLKASRDNRVADAEATAAAARGEAANARADAARMRQAMRDYQMQQTQLGATLVLQDVVFTTGKADLKPGAANRLKPLAGYLQANPNVQVRIDGHTDSVGTPAANQRLSEVRAQSVRAALIGMGVAASRIEAVGHGQDKPVASNATAAGKLQNRRVEVTLVGQQAGAFAGM